VLTPDGPRMLENFLTLRKIGIREREFRSRENP
jgi:hypothetical protein